MSGTHPAPKTGTETSPRAARAAERAGSFSGGRDAPCSSHDSPIIGSRWVSPRLSQQLKDIVTVTQPIPNNTSRRRDSANSSGGSSAVTGAIIKSPIRAIKTTTAPPPIHTNGRLLFVTDCRLADITGYRYAGLSANASRRLFITSHLLFACDCLFRTKAPGHTGIFIHLRPKKCNNRLNRGNSWGVLSPYR